MKLKSCDNIRVIAAAVALFFTAADGAFGWDQLGEFKFDSHSVITYDATIDANNTLRDSRSGELANWMRILNQIGRDSEANRPPF